MSVTLHSRIPELTRDADRRIKVAVNTAGRLVEAGARSRARVDTGAMRAGIRWGAESDYEGRVIGHAPHTIYNEFGTRYMSAQPMLVPAAEEVRPAFHRAISEAYR